MKKLTIAELKRRKTVKVIRIVDQLSIDEMREKITAWFVSNELNIEELQETSESFSYREHFWFKPKSENFTEGVVTFRSNDYFFTYIKDGKEVNSYGNIEAKNLLHDGWFIETFKGNKITYKIMD